MPLFIDVHEHLDGLTDDAAAKAHQADLETQERYKVKYLRYWYDTGTGHVFCLIEAPDKASAIAVHQHGHGLVADRIVEVKEGV
jgi:hypothetical protein